MPVIASHCAWQKLAAVIINSTRKILPRFPPDKAHSLQKKTVISPSHRGNFFSHPQRQTHRLYSPGTPNFYLWLPLFLPISMQFSLQNLSQIQRHRIVPFLHGIHISWKPSSTATETGRNQYQQVEHLSCTWPTQVQPWARQEWSRRTEPQRSPEQYWLWPTKVSQTLGKK